MDWSNERYVRLYVRDTTTWQLLGWDGQAVLMQLLRKLDRSGVMDLGGVEPWEAVVLHCRAPEEAAKAGMASCLKRGVLVHDGDRLVMPNYIAAQEAIKSDKQRQRESRETRGKVTKPDGSVTNRDQESRAVMETSQPVTRGHAESRAVTDGHSVLCSAVPSSAGGERSPTPPKPAPEADDATAYDRLEPWAVLWRIWVDVALDGIPAGSVAASKPGLEAAWKACEAREPGAPGALFETAARAFVADSVARNKRPTLRFLLNDLGEWLTKPGGNGGGFNPYGGLEVLR